MNASRHNYKPSVELALWTAPQDSILFKPSLLYALISGFVTKTVRGGVLKITTKICSLSSV